MRKLGRKAPDCKNVDSLFSNIASVCILKLHVDPPFQIVEELEDRFGDMIDVILSTVRGLLMNALSTPEAPLTNGGDHPPEQFVYDEAVYGEPERVGNTMRTTSSSTIRAKAPELRGTSTWTTIFSLWFASRHAEPKLRWGTIDSTFWRGTLGADMNGRSRD